MKRAIKKAFSTQNRTSYVHNKEDNVLVFGVVSSMVSLVTGAFMFLFFVNQDVLAPVRVLGLLWMIYSGLLLVGIELFEKGKKKAAAIYLTVLGMLGLLFGAGFFIGGLMTLLAGYFAFRYYHKLHKN